MSTRKLIGLAVVLTMIASGALAFRLDGTLDYALGSNITIDDLSHTISPGDMIGVGTGNEDEEVDYRSPWGQQWDLEGFFFDANTRVLTGVGGFDFDNGINYVFAGDVFIDVTGDYAIPGYAPTSPDTLGYDYVLDIDWANYTYNIVDISGGATLQNVWPDNAGANPYRYVSGGRQIGNGTLLDYEEGLGDDLNLDTIVDVLGQVHNAFQIDMSWLSGGFTVHQTMTCGNDGHNGQVPDAGATLALLGVALFGLGALARRRG